MFELKVLMLFQLMKKQQQNNSQSNHRQIHMNEVEWIEQIALKIDLSFSFC